MLRKFLLVTITLCFSMFMGFGQVFDNAPDYPKYAPELLKQDLDFIFKKYGEIHPSTLPHIEDRQ